MPSKRPHRPMSDQAVARWRAFLCEWRSPAVAEMAVDILGSLSGDHFLDDPRLKWAKEAHLAAWYGKAKDLEAVRICRTDPPDFEGLGRAGTLHRCEAVEVLRPGRRRDQELRRERLKPPRIINDPEDDWLNADQALAAVDAQIAKKAANGYRELLILVVYVNLGFVKGSANFRARLLDRERVGHPAFKGLHFL